MEKKQYLCAVFCGARERMCKYACARSEKLNKNKYKK